MPSCSCRSAPMHVVCVLLKRQLICAVSCSGSRRQALEAERRQLPVWGAREALLAEVRANRALIVVGETGSGKTTQVNL